MDSRTVSTSQLRHHGTKMYPSELIELQMTCKILSGSVKDTYTIFYIDLINRGEQFTVHLSGLAGSYKYIMANTDIRGLDRDRLLAKIRNSENFEWARHDGIEMIVAELIYRSIFQLLKEYKNGKTKVS